jgi:hypothetical protein
MSIIRFYEDAWYKVKFYDIEKMSFKFLAQKIEALDSDNLENSEINESNFVKGKITWDFELEISTEMIWRNKDYQDQFNLLIEKILAFGKEQEIFIAGDNF